MDITKILEKVDHTLLSPTATWADIQRICDEGMAYHTASVCIPAVFIPAAAKYVNSKLTLCTVVGFPNGYTTTAAKCFEAKDAIANGAAEIDTVIHQGAVKAGDFDAIARELAAMRDATAGHILKVIIETCVLTDNEKIKLCNIVADSGADFIKTSTGFAGGGATRADVALLVKHARGRMKVKAAGGIATLQDAADMIALGANRLGTSRIISLIQRGEQHEQTVSDPAY